MIAEKGQGGIRIGNGSRVANLTLGVVNLKLSSRDYLSSEECYFVPCIVKSCWFLMLINCQNFDQNI